MQKLTMKGIKSILSIFLVMALILLISGCGKQGNNGDTTANEHEK